MTDHNIVRMVHAIEERISGGSATDTNSAGRVQASVDGTFLADVISVKPLSIQLQGVVERLGVDGPVEPPPEVFQRRDKIGAGGDFRLNPARQTGVEVVMGADQAGHHQPALHLNHLRAHIALLQPAVDREDQVIFNRNINLLPHFRREELRGGGIFQDGDTHCSTSLSR